MFRMFRLLSMKFCLLPEICSEKLEFFFKSRNFFSPGPVLYLETSTVDSSRSFCEVFPQLLFIQIVNFLPPSSPSCCTQNVPFF